MSFKHLLSIQILLFLCNQGFENSSLNTQHFQSAITSTAKTQEFEGLRSIESKHKDKTPQFSVGLMAQPIFELDLCTPNERLLNKLKNTKNLIALWDFKEKAGETRKSVGKSEFALKEAVDEVTRKNGPLSGYSAQFDGGNYMSLPQLQVDALNIHGKKQGVTVMAWVKWTGEQTGFVGGLWNEYQDGGKRQYGLFVSLPHYNGTNQACGHISQTGKPTPPFPYSLDYSASKQEVPANEWVSVAFTYNGKDIKSYINGVFEPREAEMIKNTKGFEGYPDGLVQSKNPYYFPHGMGDNGSDFTVGAVLLKRGMGNFFKGQIGGLAVFDRALSEKEMRALGEL